MEVVQEVEALVAVAAMAALEAMRWEDRLALLGMRMIDSKGFTVMVVSIQTIRTSSSMGEIMVHRSLASSTSGRMITDRMGSEAAVTNLEDTMEIGAEVVEGFEVGLVEAEAQLRSFLLVVEAGVMLCPVMLVRCPSC